jgi:glutamine amidotransferase
MIAIIDYGLGNIKAFVHVYNQLNIPFVVAKQCKDLKNVTKVILPGVGAFDNAIKKIENSGMRPALDELVLRNNLPVLGICVGMQMLAHSSEEGSLPGLGWIDGEVRKLNLSASTHSKPHPLPHMGWNGVEQVRKSKLFESLQQDARFYFLHSYYFQCQKDENVLAITDYCGKFACAVSSGNILGVQFHPEKSHQSGVSLLKNFAEL